MKKIFSNRAIITSLSTLAILACGTVAFASQTTLHIHKGTPNIYGTITAINGATLTVSTTAKTPVVYTVNTSKAMVLGPKGITLANLTTGEKISMEGIVSGVNVTAQNIIVMPKTIVTHGTLSSISTTSISVTETSGKNSGSVQTFTINNHTRSFFPGNKSASTSSLMIGDQVVVMGMTDPVTGNLDAMDVNDFPGTAQH